VTRTGEWEICSVCRRLPDYLGELAYMHREVNDFFRTQMLLLWQLLIEIFHLNLPDQLIGFFLGLHSEFSLFQGKQIKHPSSTDKATGKSVHKFWRNWQF